MFKVGDKIRYNTETLSFSLFARAHSENFVVIDTKHGRVFGQSILNKSSHLNFSFDEIEIAKKRVG